MHRSTMNLAVCAALQYIGEQWAYAQWMSLNGVTQRFD